MLCAEALHENCFSLSICLGVEWHPLSVHTGTNLKYWIFTWRNVVFRGHFIHFPIHFVDGFFIIRLLLAVVCANCL